MKKIVDMQLFANPRHRISYVVENGTVVAIHTESQRMSPDEMAEILDRIMEAEEIAGRDTDSE